MAEGLLQQFGGEFIAALLGALAGSLSAYYGQQKAEKLRLQEEHHGALILAQLALIGQVNSLENLREQYLDPYRNNPRRDKEMVMFSQVGSQLAINYDALAFLLMTDYSNLPLEISVAERSYQSAMSALEMRNIAFEKFHAKGRLIEADSGAGTCKIAADPRDLRFLKDTTDSLYEITDNALIKCDKAIHDLRSAGKVIFPKKKFLSFEKKT